MMCAVNRIGLLVVLATAAPARADEFDPLDNEGWPKNLSLEDMRALPECSSPLPHTPGAPLTCRPPIAEGGVQWGMGFDWTSGATMGTVPTEGGAHAFGIELDFALARTVQLAARYEIGGIALPAPMPGADGGTGFTQHALGMLKY